MVFVPVPFLPVSVLALFLDPSFACAAEPGDKIVDFADILATCNHLRPAEHLRREDGTRSRLRIRGVILLVVGIRHDLLAFPIR